MHSGHVASHPHNSTTPKFWILPHSLGRRNLRFPRAPSMKSSIGFEFVYNSLCLLVASESISDAITMAMWIPEVYAVLASFFQDDISCFMANDWFWESFLNSLYDFALCSSCSSINSLAFFFFQPALLFPPCSAMRALYLGPVTFEMYSLWAILESVFWSVQGMHPKGFLQYGALQSQRQD